MNKQELKQAHLETGDILHCWSDGIIGKLIRRFEKSNLNHTAIFIRINGLPYVIEAQARGIYPVPFDVWVERYNYTYSISRYKHKRYSNRDENVNKLLSKSGVPYDYFALLVHHPIHILTGIWVGRRGEDAQGRMFCSEFAAWFVGYKDYYLLSPQQFYSRIRKDINYRTFE